MKTNNAFERVKSEVGEAQLTNSKMNVTNFICAIIVIPVAVYLCNECIHACKFTNSNGELNETDQVVRREN